MKNTQPLTGLTIINTRPKAQAKVLTKIIQDAGGTSIECETIEIKPLTLSTVAYPSFDRIIFTSRHAIEHLPTSIKATLTAHPHLYAIGKKTAEYACHQQLNIKQHQVEANSEALLNTAELLNVKGKQIALIKGRGGRKLLAETLKAQGGHVTEMNTYERCCPGHVPIAIQNLWKTDGKFIILGTSVESIDNLFMLLTGPALEALRAVPWLIISERVQHAAASHGISHTILSSPHSLLDDLLKIKCRTSL